MYVILSITNCFDFFSNLKLTETEQHIARDILKEIKERLEFLINVGLNYLTLNRLSSTLSVANLKELDWPLKSVLILLAFCMCLMNLQLDYINATMHA